MFRSFISPPARTIKVATAKQIPPNVSSGLGVTLSAVRVREATRYRGWMHDDSAYIPDPGRGSFPAFRAWEDVSFDVDRPQITRITQPFVP
jgi:hypothetical protein